MRPRSHTGLAAAGSLLLLLAACSGEPGLDGPSAPSTPGVPAAFEGSSFRLTIDVQSGAIRIAPPAAPVRSAAGPSFSLLGSDAIALHAGTCTWSSVPKTTKLKRCTFDLAIENRLRETDLVTPAEFPGPPAGTTGIMVFPIAAGALGGKSTGATPSPDWDRGPANFFNDFASCPTGVTSDCYRYELFAELPARTTSAAATVGFDVDKSAQSVSASIVVAADLADRAPTTLSIRGGGSQCGTLSGYGGVPSTVATDVLNLFVGARRDGSGTYVQRSFCTIGLGASLQDKLILDARLEMYQRGDDTGSPFEELGSVLVEHVSYGESLDLDDYDATPLQPTVGVLSSDRGAGYRSVDVTKAILDDLVNGRSTAQFRLRFANEAPAGEGGTAAYLGSIDLVKLVMHYREK
jgi:hypothetical protein